MTAMERPFGLWTATAMVVGGMIGAGIFVLPAIVAPFGWSSTLAWLAAGTGTLLVARVIAALFAKRPMEPSLVTISGDILGLLPARLMAWIYWIAIVTSLPVLAMTTAGYVLHLFPQAPQGIWSQVIGGSFVLLAIAALNLRGVRAAGVMQVVTTLLKLIPLVLVVAIALWLVLDAPQTFTYSQVAPVDLGAVAPALGMVFFAMVSFEGAALLAERVRDPKRNVPRAMYLGIGVVLTLYILVCTAIVVAMPLEELRASTAPIALFVDRYLGTAAGKAVALFAAISAAGCLNCLILLLGELPLGMVRIGQMPRALAAPNSRGVASHPLLAGVTIGLALMLGSVTGMGDAVLGFMLKVTTATNVWFYLLVCVAALVDGLVRPVTLAGLAFLLWVLWGVGLEAGVLGLGLVLLGVPLHFAMGARTTRHDTLTAGA